tara:strand:+ start:28193 stop:28354 length:162 start_codon:yes stop_codon:yes gene_type:complete
MTTIDISDMTFEINSDGSISIRFFSSTTFSINLLDGVDGDEAVVSVTRKKQMD